jgi:hypothetical protein
MSNNPTKIAVSNLERTRRDDRKPNDIIFFGGRLCTLLIRVRIDNKYKQSGMAMVVSICEYIIAAVNMKTNMQAGSVIHEEGKSSFPNRRSNSNARYANIDASNVNARKNAVPVPPVRNVIAVTIASQRG